MRILFSILLILVFCAEISAQNTYFKGRYEYQQNDASLGLGVIGVQDGYISYGAMKLPAQPEFHAAFFKTDFDGVPMDTLTWSIPNHIIEIKSLFELNSTDIIAVGHIRNFNQNPSVFSPYIVKLTQDLDTLWTITLDMHAPGDTSVFVWKAILCSDSTIAISGILQDLSNIINDPNDYDNEMYLLRIDTLGNVIHFSTHGTPNSKEGGGGVSETLDGGFVLSGSSTLNHPGGPGYDYHCVLKLDANYNEEWWRIWGRNDAANGGADVLNSNDSTIIIATARAIEPGVYPMLRRISNLKKITYNNATVWDYDYGVPRDFSGALFLTYFQQEDSTFIGIRRDQIQWPILTKIDTDGAILWERQHNVINGDHNYAPVVYNPNDGGYVMSGFLMPVFSLGDTGTQDIYLIKTNCLGFAAPPVASATYGSMNNLEVVMQNQSQHYGTCYWHWGDGMVDTTTEFMSSTVYHTYPAQGNYTVMLIAEACGDRDTTYINVYASPVGVHEPEKPKPFKVWPNPTNGYLNVQAEEVHEQLEIVLTDITGRTVLHKRTTQADYFLLDVSGFAKGVYVLQLANKNGALHVEKLILD